MKPRFWVVQAAALNVLKVWGFSLLAEEVYRRTETDQERRRLLCCSSVISPGRSPLIGVLGRKGAFWEDSWATQHSPTLSWQQQHFGVPILLLLPCLLYQRAVGRCPFSSCSLPNTENSGNECSCRRDGSSQLNTVEIRRYMSLSQYD